MAMGVKKEKCRNKIMQAVAFKCQIAGEGVMMEIHCQYPVRVILYLSSSLTSLS
jgi:hypothetical protein